MTKRDSRSARDQTRHYVVEVKGAQTALVLLGAVLALAFALWLKN